jgi:hypothetical protein
MIHACDCAVNNGPALSAEPCDCGLELAPDAAAHGSVGALISWARSHGFFVEDVGGKTLVQAHQFPAERFVVSASTAYLPDAHKPVTFGGDANSVNLDDASVAVISEFEPLPGG